MSPLVTSLDWSFIMERVEAIRMVTRGAPVYGVPRGGAVVAGLVGNAVDHHDAADFIVDDIRDTGKTAARWEQSGKPVLSLVDKRLDQHRELGWVVFPWEERDPTADLHDTVVRQLEFLGEDPNREGLKKTPRRVISALKDLTTGYSKDPKEILSTAFDERCDEMVVVSGIDYWSLCEHHMLPFHGQVSVAYIPNGKVVGLSKIPRLVECYARRLQIQERFTQQIATAINDNLDPLGVGVVVTGLHLCCAMRGVKKATTMRTSALLGLLKEKTAARAEFLTLAGK